MMQEEMDEFMGFSFFEGENREEVMLSEDRVSSPETTDGSSSTSGDEPAFMEDFLNQSAWRPIPFEDDFGTCW